MAPPRRPGRPLLSASAGDATYFPGGRTGRVDQQSDWFPVRLTGTAGETDAGQTQYTGFEVWVDPRGETVEVVGGRVLTEAQPGVFLGGRSGPTEYDFPVLCLARLGPGSGGRFWELVSVPAVGGSGSGGDGGTGCDLDTVSFNIPVVDLENCVVTYQRVSITGCGLSISTAPQSGGG